MNGEQVRAILWLRWRLSRNQVARHGRASAVVAFIGLILAGLLSVGSGAAGVFFGATAGARATPGIVLLVWDGLVVVFLLLWFVGLLAELQRSEMIDLTRLLHLPIALKQVFVLNYLASHLSLTLAILVPSMLGLAVGLTVSRGLTQVLLIPLGLSFVFMVTAWTYCLRGWLVSLMVNPRRRRSILMGMTVGLVLVVQVPNLLFNVFDWRPHRDPRSAARGGHQDGSQTVPPESAIPPAVVAAHWALPPFWLPASARMLARGEPLPALLSTVGLVGLGGIGLRRAYRATVRFYQGDETRKAIPSTVPAEKANSTPASTSTNQFRRGRMLEWRVPGVAEDTGALALTYLRCMLRAPEVRMALVMNLVMVVVMLGVFLRPNRPPMPELFRPFIASGLAILPLFGMLQLLFNQFGYDREGFRAMVLLPVRRDRVLLAKNLAALPLALVFAILMTGVLALLAGPSPWLAITALLQFGSAYLLASLAGNALSMLAPYRVAPGSLKPTKMPASRTLIIILSNLLFPVLMLPVFLPPGLGWLMASLGWMPGPSAVMLVALVVFAGLAGVYRLFLPLMGRTLQAREKEILRFVTEEVE